MYRTYTFPHPVGNRVLPPRTTQKVQTHVLRYRVRYAEDPVGHPNSGSTGDVTGQTPVSEHPGSWDRARRSGTDVGLRTRRL